MAAGDRVRRALLGLFVVGLASSITLSQAALALLALEWLWRCRTAPMWRAVPLAGPLLAFAGATLVSALASGAVGPSLFAAKGLWLAAALVVTAAALTGPRAADRLLTGLVLVFAVAAALGLAQVGACPGSAAPEAGWPRLLFHRCQRARGFFSIYMTLAGGLTLVLLAALPRLGERGVRPAFVGAWVVSLGGLVATLTRGAWLGFAAGAAALMLTMRRGRLLVAGGLVLLVLGALAGPYELRHRLESMGDPGEAGVRERLFMWQSGVALWRERPWLGVGPGGVKRLYPRYALPEAFKQRTSHVHSAPLQILVERGLVGFVAWVWIWVAFFVRAGQVRRRLPPGDHLRRALVVGPMAAVAGFLVAGLSEYNFGDAEVVLVAWVVMALPFIAGREEPAPRPCDRPSPAARG